MERIVYELLITLLTAILIINLVSIDRFWPSKKHKGPVVSHPIPLWRRWRPSDPSRCDCCRAEALRSQLPVMTLTTPTGSSQRSKRGRKKTVDSAGHFCTNPECQYHENADAQTHALASNGRHGRQRIRQWVCQACGTYVSERYDTVMSNLKKHPDDVARTLEMLNRGSSQADVAEHHRHTPRTVRRWLNRVAIQSLRIHDRVAVNFKMLKLLCTN